MTNSISLLSKSYLKLYVSNWKNSLRRGRSFHLRDTIDFLKHYKIWCKSLGKSYWEGPIQDGIPWMTFSAIDFLDARLSKNDKVFEYGTGGSTIFFAERVNTVVSIEHDLEWLDLVMQTLNFRNIANVNATCIKGESLTNHTKTKINDSDYQYCYSTKTGLYFNQYVNQINNYPDDYFDWVVIDGRARPSCIKEAISKVKPGKYLLIDNSERAHYQPAINNFLEAWDRTTFEGPTPYLKWFTQTSIWKKPQ